jgi:hypothetical protein
MKSVLIATDYLKDIDGSFKVLEINTNIGFVFRDMDQYINYDLLDTFIQENNINKIEIISPKILYLNVVDLETENDINIDNLGSKLVERYSGETITVNVHFTQKNSVLIPQIVDDENTLIIRLSYDTSALIDDTYCRDNYEFLNLMYNQDLNSIPKTYINDVNYGFDTIGETLKDNGNHPNYLIKERFPTTDYDTYPKVLKINSTEHLLEIKNNLEENKILQEYIFNPDDSENGKLKTYRVISMLYGPNLDVLDLFEPFIHTNSINFEETVDYKENGEIEFWERPCYVQKYVDKDKLRTLYHFDNESKVLLSDGTITSINNIQTGSVLKTLSFPDMPLNEIEPDSFLWKKPFNELEEGLNVTTTNVEYISSKLVRMWMVNIQLDNGSNFVDVEYGKVLAKHQDETEYQFVLFNSLSTGDSILLFNNETNLIESSQIIDLKYTYEELTVFTADVEEIDAFLTMEEGISEPKYSILQHNVGPACSAYCCSSGYNGASSYPQCIGNGFSGYCGGSNSYEYCIEDGYGTPSGCFQCLPACISCGSVQK